MIHFKGKHWNSWKQIGSLWSIGLLFLAFEVDGQLLTYSAQLWYFDAYFWSECLIDQRFYASLD